MTPMLQRIRERASDPPFDKEKMRKEAARIVQEELNVVDEYFFSHGGEEMSWIKKGMGVGFDEAKEQLLPLIEALIQAVEVSDKALKCYEPTTVTQAKVDGEIYDNLHLGKLAQEARASMQSILEKAVK